MAFFISGGATMYDLFSEIRLTLTQLAQELGIHISTCWRWDRRGIRGHHLECFSLGGRRYTTREALARFIAATNGRKLPPQQTSRDRESAIEKAERDLDEILKRKERRDGEN